MVPTGRLGGCILARRPDPFGSVSLGFVPRCDGRPVRTFQTLSDAGAPQTSVVLFARPNHRIVRRLGNIVESSGRVLLGASYTWGEPGKSCNVALGFTAT